MFNRNTFRGAAAWIVALAIVFGLSVGAASPDESQATPEQPAQANLHPLLLHTPKPIDAEKNARAPLLRIKQLLEDVNWRELADLTDDLRATKERPPASLQAKIRNFLSQHGDPFPLVVEATQCDCLSFKDLEEQNLLLNCLFRVDDFFVLRDAVDESPAESAQRWQVRLELANVLCGENSDAGHIRGLRMAEDASLRMSHLAGRDSTSIEVVDSMLRHLQRNMFTDAAIVQGLRADFHSEVLVKVSSLPDNDDPADAVQSIFGLKEPDRPSQAWIKYRDQFEKRKRDILALLAEHPASIVKKDTLDEATAIFQEAAENVGSPWNAQKRVLRSEMEDAVGIWPEALSLHIMDYMTLFMGNEQPDVPIDEFRAARKHLLKVHNPMGKHLLIDHEPYSLVDYSFRCRTVLHGSHALLAIRLYEKRHGELPATLEAMVDNGILDSPIRDPFGGVLHYSRERRILWSVGPNGIDDGGVPESLDKRATFEFLRKMRPPGAPELPPTEDEPKTKGADLVMAIAPSSR